MWRVRTVPVALHNTRGLHRRLSFLGSIHHPRVVTTVTRTHRRNSLGRGTRCRTTHRRRNFYRNHVGSVRTGLSGTRIVSIAGVPGGKHIVFNTAMAILGLSSSRRRACHVINSSRTSFGRGLVSMGSPVTHNLVNGRRSSIIIVGAPNNRMRFRMVGIRCLWRLPGARSISMLWEGRGNHCTTFCRQARHNVLLSYLQGAPHFARRVYMALKWS